MLSALFFSKKRTASANIKDKIVTIHKIFDALCLFFLHGVSKNLIYVLIAWS